jgi:hypothetical protein
MAASANAIFLEKAADPRNWTEAVLNGGWTVHSPADGTC